MKTSESKYCQCMYFASSALARKMEKLALESWKKVGLSPSHGYLLMLVIEEPGIQPGTLADELQLSPSTVTRLIEKLEERKLVVRTTEGKITNVFPTSAGKDIRSALKECAEHFHHTYASILGAEESARLVQNINRITDKLNP
ncbi:MarR family winged helix-turn-helix transcriptional regulator [Flavihumibacter rivuli]|uniref:MarR family winged helix-turn-helix transcriptional regulator n=1 Tax=Flavihumibacter rivuli TaxID=2838156 RepID=UPI001BDF1EBD|nr:MarR family winged helix-turn-helix transcriptional regulator [Flavihumibacter rivuli]ULQ56410.1 MarR family winged helix-turn-helix transcriptional regulator [Flavihumibacter rivuli]